MSVKLEIIFLLAHVCVLCLGLDLNRTEQPPRTTSPPLGALGYKFEPKTGQWYKFHTEGARWTAANRTCVSEGAHLAIINSRTEERFLRDLHQEYLDQIHDADWTNWVAIGIYRDPDLNIEHQSIWITNASWKTVDGQTLEQTGYSNWYGRHPLPYPKATYGFFTSRSTHGTLASFNEDHTAAFICEK